MDARWLSYADHVFEVVGFDGLEGFDNVAANPLYKEHHGLLKALKIPSVSGLNLAPISRPLTYDWAFKVKRRQFVLQVQSSSRVEKNPATIGSRSDMSLLPIQFSLPFCST